jgi:glycosyltransferase involved in cell wall biosynthesis
MLVSLIICTRNRALSLRNCLAYVRQLQSPGDWELIVVDNASSDETPDVLKEFAATAPFPVVLLQEPNPGLSRARNTGVARAAGAIIAFTDDDCYVSANFLKEIVRVFEDQTIGYMGGRVLLYDPSDAPIMRSGLEPYRIEPLAFVRVGQPMGANMALRRSLLASIGAFDPEFGAGSRFRAGEDTELQVRASASGAMGAYDPGPLVWHHHGRKPGRGYDRLIEGYLFGRGAYFAKFILDSRTRPVFLKNWYWATVSNLRNRQFSVIWWQFYGAFHYVLFRVWGQRSGTRASASSRLKGSRQG